MFKKYFLASFLFSSYLYANEYGFSMDELETIQTKSYEFGGYVQGDYKYQKKEKDSQDSYLGELFFDFRYFKDDFTFNIQTSAVYENIASKEDDDITLNQIAANYKINSNHELNVGKISPKWGKGYFFNPVAFIDRKKDPNDPEVAREGFFQLNYKYNKVFSSDLKNISFDAVFLKTTKDTNEYIYASDSNIAAFKLYMLYRDIDIDFIYSYSNKDTNKAGFDFSTNLKTNFELHGEYARYDNGYFSYLLGLKYLTSSDLTIISEYFYQNTNLLKSEPFWDKSYLINSFNQKEPFDILYTSVYFKNILNLQDDSFQNKIGFIYTAVKNLEVDFSLSENRGSALSEFGLKLIDKTAWLKLRYGF